MQMKSRIKLLIHLGRLYMLPGTFLALMAGIASFSEVTVSKGVEAFFMSFLLNFIFFSPNEIFDTESDRHNERKGSWMGGVVEDTSFSEAVAGTSVFMGYLLALILGDTVGIALAGVTTVSVLYSVPPVRLKTRPPFDSAVNGLGVFLIFSTGVGIAGGGFSDVISGAYWFSLITTGYHILLAVPDIDADRKAGLKTTAMYLGWRKASVLTQVFILAAVYFENWSVFTRNFLLLQFFGLFLGYRDWDSEDTWKLVVLGVVALLSYLTIYVYTRGI